LHPPLTNVSTHVQLLLLKKRSHHTCLFIGIRERARTKERRREKEREGLPPAALLPYAAAAQCSNLRWELSGCDPPPCVVFFLYL